MKSTTQNRLADFSSVIERCSGMLPPTVYQKIYEVGQRGGMIVEIGTALGAGTVALALGLKDSGLPGHVYTFDPMLGGPRRQISAADDRVAHIQDSLAHYGVLDRVTIIPRALTDGIALLPTDQEVNVLMIDADGRIDRDLILLKDRLSADCQLIIDDVDDQVRVRGSGARYFVDSKMRLSFLLVGFLQRANVISTGHQIKDTYFGAWLGDPNAVLSPSPVLDVYRDMIFQHASRDHFKQWRSDVIWRLGERFPKAIGSLRKMYRQRQFGMPA
ncbi:class I SAM-dependent methyltransferase [Sphingomonas sp. H160509]|uniref:class I SAM-dependent methyltransferase n=1 Tax=Sphingomonas sp. H160509 TaxID=2955313 RepID=UPI0020970C3C|nr:class I SAM-dependent methyltransferase [Sphingomonas sp. H160509]MDD1450838.1 class I SAM-dependent methyltransferase [Sphingomonas sp. H160509]